MKNKVGKFCIWTYLCFWAGIMMTGGVMLLGAPDWAVKAVSTAIAWVPTVVFLILFPQLLPEEKNRIDYIKKLFQGKRLGITSLFILVLQSGVFFLSVYIIEKVMHQSFTDLFQINTGMLLGALVTTLLSGASGEELGWRGFVHFQLTSKYGVIKGSILVGLIWSFWHTPLWFITSGYQGISLLYYVLAFLISNISASVIIGILYNKKKNLLIPVLLHYLFNFWAEFYIGDRAILLAVLAGCYLLGAVIIALCYRRKNAIMGKEIVWNAQGDQ